jgi:hypothetical protein
MVTLRINSTAAAHHYSLIKVRLANRITTILARGKIGNAPNIVSLDDKTRLLLRALRRDDWLKRIITCPPDDLVNVITKLTGMLPALNVPNSACLKVLYNIFVDSCYEKAEHFDKLEFIKRINVDSCVYCNRNYTYALSKSKKIKPELDHFFPKSQFPYLGMSFYNLIPSCETCNGVNAKYQADPLAVGLKNPYLITANDFRFTYKINSLDLVNPFSSSGSISIRFKARIQGHLDIFKLDALYEKHSDHVIELIVKSKYKYSEHYRKHLQSLKGLNLSDNEINRMIIGSYVTEEEVHKRPLAKLYQDIAKELGLIPK